MGLNLTFFRVDGTKFDIIKLIKQFFLCLDIIESRIYYHTVVRRRGINNSIFDAKTVVVCT